MRFALKIIAALALLAVATLAGACRKKEQPADVKLELANKVSARTIRLYYEAPDLLLAAEPRSVPLPESAAAALPGIIRELVKGSVNPSVPRPLPADTQVRGAYLLADGTAIIDLGGPTLVAGWNAGSHEEMIAIYAIVQTVTENVPEAKRVRLLLNGQPAETLAGHIMIDRSLRPMASLVRPQIAAAPPAKR